MNIPIKIAKNRFTKLVRQAEAGETVTITRNGKPVADIVPHKRHGGIDFEAIDKYWKEKGIDKPVLWISSDFDDPLPEDFLLRPLPE